MSDTNSDVLKMFEAVERSAMVQIFRNYGTPDEIMYLSKLVSKKDLRVIVLTPIKNGALVPFSMTIDYTFHLFSPDNQIIGVNARFLKAAKTGDLNVVAFELDSYMHRVQRRNFSRIHAHIEIKFKRQTLRGSAVYKGVILDIGAGGMRMIADDVIEPEETLKFNLPLEGIDNIVLVGKILRRSNLKGDTEYKYGYRIVFVDIAETDQEKIVRYVFDRQRELLGRQ